MRNICFSSSYYSGAVKVKVRDNSKSDTLSIRCNSSTKIIALKLSWSKSFNMSMTLSLETKLTKCDVTILMPQKKSAQGSRQNFVWRSQLIAHSRRLPCISPKKAIGIMEKAKSGENMINMP